MSANLVVGCPVAGRQWILPHWFDYTEDAIHEAGFFMGNVWWSFVVPADDEATLKVLYERAPQSRRSIIFVEGDTVVAAKRNWGKKGRFQTMVSLRNRLLDDVVSLAPDYFWSLDSDMLPQHDSLGVCLELLEEGTYGAVGMRTFMTPPPAVNASSHGQYVNGRIANRTDVPRGHFRTDVVMGSVVFRGDKLENLRYGFHTQGEDVGMALSAKEHGVVLGWSADATCKHVMTQKMLLDDGQPAKDERLGW